MFYQCTSGKLTIYRDHGSSELNLHEKLKCQIAMFDGATPDCHPENFFSTLKTSPKTFKDFC